MALRTCRRLQPYWPSAAILDRDILLSVKPALANLQFGNGANGLTNVIASVGQLRALGLTFGTNPDGTITVGTSFDTTIAVWQHEINEILGGGGIGPTLGNPLAQAFGATDLYRYSGLHTPSYTRDTSATACLSVDGGATCIALRASIKAASAISEISSRPPWARASSNHGKFAVLPSELLLRPPSPASALNFKC